MTLTLHIKNMVCKRCISTVLHEFNVLDFTVKSIELGQVVVEETNDVNKISKLKIALKGHGFEIIENEVDTLVEQIKVTLIHKIEKGKTADLFKILAVEFGKSETALSKLFSKHEGVTLEKYTINLKIEKVKELIQLGQLNFSEIAYSLNYNNSSHLAKQFKTNTGMSMSDYKSLQAWDRKPLDGIV
jgi:AraC-like DNA-binding protein|tara:strand:+ start:3500 stop:4060 length:561 start_codon:yes stop_codon:yes gene_type:complete